jgi:hypothetical protein
MGADAIRVLTSVPFGLALAVLVINDWVLKPAVSNWLTGKISDVAGLAAFAMFWAAVFPRQRRAAFVITAAAFAAWKSPLADAPLRAWNELGRWPLARVVDYSDLLALVVLPLAYRALSHNERRHEAGHDTVASGVRAVATGLAAIMAFAATSVRRPTPLNEVAYALPADRGSVIAALDSVGLPVSDRRKHDDANSADTLVVNVRYPPERWLAITVEVRDLSSGESEIRPLFLIAAGPEPSAEGWRRAFVAQIVQPVHEWLVRRDTRND